MGVLMGIDLNAFERPEGADFDPSNPDASAPPPAASSTPAASSSAPPPPTASTSKPAPATKVPEPKEEEAEPMEVDDDASHKAESLELKSKGNAAYKSRQFEEAIELYEKAWETWPKDISYLTNLAGES